MDSVLAFPLEEGKIFSVSQLNSGIRELVESAYPFVLVMGEVSGLRTPSSGHHYFTLKDDRSQVRAVMFRAQQRTLRFALESGIEVICRARVSVYEPRGEYQLIVEAMEPKGAGALQVAFEQLKRKLGEEGLFDEKRKKPLPLCPLRIAVITSATGAAIRDILKTLQRSPYPLCVTVFPVRVQGREAAPEIAAALAKANRSAEALNLDLILLGRGGGSLEDLWPFNEETVARAVAASDLPVISAVGHEIDFTISDAVADLRAPTPTAAAQWVVTRLEALDRELSSLRDGMHRTMAREMDSFRQRVDYLEKRLVSPGRRLEDLRLFVDDRAERLQRAFAVHIQKLRTACAHRQERLLYHNPLKALLERRTIVGRKEKELMLHFRNILDKHRLELRKYSSQLEGLNPLSVLERGYSITHRLPDGKVVRTTGDAPVGSTIRVRLYEGTLVCTVEGSEQ